MLEYIIARAPTLRTRFREALQVSGVLTNDRRNFSLMRREAPPPRVSPAGVTLTMYSGWGGTARGDRGASVASVRDLIFRSHS